MIFLPNERPHFVKTLFISSLVASQTIIPVSQARFIPLDQESFQVSAYGSFEFHDSSTSFADSHRTRQTSAHENAATAMDQHNSDQYASGEPFAQAAFPLRSDTVVQPKSQKVKSGVHGSSVNVRSVSLISLLFDRHPSSGSSRGHLYQPMKIHQRMARTRPRHQAPKTYPRSRRRGGQKRRERPPR
jgi:hypothetical protein